MPLNPRYGGQRPSICGVSRTQSMYDFSDEEAYGSAEDFESGGYIHSMYGGGRRRWGRTGHRNDLFGGGSWRHHEGRFARNIDEDLHAFSGGFGRGGRQPYGHYYPGEDAEEYSGNDLMYEMRDLLQSYQDCVAAEPIDFGGSYPGEREYYGDLDGSLSEGFGGEIGGFGGRYGGRGGGAFDDFGGGLGGGFGQGGFGRCGRGGRR